ncbi:myosin light chain kinase, smooth muscle-like [Pelodytes ibericus]
MVNNEPSQAQGAYKCQVTNGGSSTVRIEEAKKKEQNETSRSPGRTVKTADRFLTVILELCPQNGSEICVRKVQSPVYNINTSHVGKVSEALRVSREPSEAKDVYRCQVKHGGRSTVRFVEVKKTGNDCEVWDDPLLAVVESESTISQQGIGVIPSVPACLPEAEDSGQEGEHAHIPATLGALHKESSGSQLESSKVKPAAIEHSQATESVSPKRKPHKSGDSLKLLNGVSYIEAKKGEQVELHCVIQGTPPLAASWVRNKKQVVDGPRISVHTSDTESRLVICQVCEEDAGCYTLCVQDQNESTQHHTNLAVVAPPSPPSGKPIISTLKPTSLTLSWSGPSYDGGSAVQCYWVEVKQVGQEAQGWKLVTNSCVNTSHQVNDGLEIGGQYQYRVRAANICGVSMPGEESDIVTMPNTGDGESANEEPIEYINVSISTTEHVNDFYIQQEKLGVGKFGQVYKLQEKATGKIRAGKFHKTRTQKEIQNARAEVELMNKLHHPRLVHCVAAFQELGRMVMVLEYIAGGELFERIVADDFEHTEIMCVQYMSQILSGVRYMHQQSIVHLDLKPENIVCVSRAGTRVKIIDFGLARELAPGTPVKVLQGTAEFVAPEVIAFEPVGFTTDMWSLGVICYILLSGDSPFQGSNDRETLQNITSACWDFDDETDAVLSVPAKDFIRHLLQKNMRSRLTADQALDHPWLQDKDISNPKTLSKERIKKFLARQKWQKTGKAVLALKRMELLSTKSDGHTASTHTDDGCDSQKVFSLLQEQLQRHPTFSSPLKDQAEVVGSTACFQCYIEGFPDPEVLWFFGNTPIQESKRFQIEYEDTGCCSLVISNVSRTDSGTYTCQALNSHGKAESSAKLTVYTLRAERPRRASHEKSV